MLPRLTIRSINATPVSVPMGRPLGTSAQVVREAPLLLIDLETDQGITGRAYLFCYLPLGAQLMARILEEVRGFLKSDPVDPVAIGMKLARRFRLIGVSGVISQALAAVDVACWDALSIAAKMPLVKFLGGAPRAIPAYNSNGLGLMPPESVADEAESLLEHGFRAVKMRLGHPSMHDDLAAAHAVRKRLPLGIDVMVDYNQALTVPEALERGRGLDPEGLAWIEEPIEHDDYAGCARIAREVQTSIQIGENFAGPHALSAALAANAADIVMVDLCRIGGVTGWREAALLAATAGIKLSSHLFPEVSAHLLCVSPTSHWLEYVDWASPVLAEPLVVVNGMVTPPNRPGTGLSWNREAVARYRVT
jgi:mandelate racemase